MYKVYWLAQSPYLWKNRRLEYENLLWLSINMNMYYFCQVIHLDGTNQDRFSHMIRIQTLTILMTKAYTHAPGTVMEHGGTVIAEIQI